MTNNNSYMIRQEDNYYLKHYLYLVCGECDNLARNHPILVTGIDGAEHVLCNREFTDWTLRTWDTYEEGNTNYVALKFPKKYTVDGVTHYQTIENRPTPKSGVKPDYYLDGITATDYSGPAADAKYQDDYDRSLEDEHFDWTKEFDAVDNWRDQSPVVHESYIKDGVKHWRIKSGEFTKADTYWWGTASSKTEPFVYADGTQQKRGGDQLNLDYDRTVYIEGLKGFFSTMLIDPIVTEKFHKTVFNLFTSKRNTLMCGSVEITTRDLFSDGTMWVHAKCVHKDCPPNDYITLPLDGTVSREYMELFIWRIISHGNNHSAHWFRSRVKNDTRIPGYQSYDFHTKQTTQITGLINLVDPKDDYSTFYQLDDYLGPVKDVEDDQTFIETLMDHNSACNNSACSCSALLKEQVPALT